MVENPGPDGAIDVFVALQYDAGEAEVVGVFRTLDEGIVALGDPPTTWKEDTPGRWTNGDLRIERHVLL